MTESTRSYGGRTAEERTTARRQRLLDATIRLMSTQGTARTTMTAICGEAGLTERYFYESFRSRDDALVTALNLVCEEIALVAVSAAAAATGGPADRVRSSLAALVGLVVQEPDKARVAVIESNSTSALRARRRELIGWLADISARQAEEIFGNRARPPERGKIQGTVFVAGLAELIAAWLVGDLDVTPEQVVDAGSDLFTAIATPPRS